MSSKQLTLFDFGFKKDSSTKVRKFEFKKQIKKNKTKPRKNLQKKQFIKKHNSTLTQIYDEKFGYK